MIRKLWEDIKNILNKTSKESDPWNKDLQPKKKITEEEMSEAVNQMNLPKPSNPYRLIFIQGFTILWILAHFVLLYVGIGTPLSIGILIYVLINFLIFSHYLLLLRGNKNDIQPEN